MNPLKKKVLEDYLQFRRLKNHSVTINDIEFQITQFFEYSDKPLKDYDDKLLTNYLTEIGKKYSTGTMNTIKSSFLKNFIKWYYEDWSSKFKNLDSICRQEKVAASYTPEEMLSEEDVKKLVQAEESHFWKAYFLTLFYGGCRPIEVCNLRWKDVEFEEGEQGGAFISIYSKKNKQTFTKYVPHDVAFYLKELKPLNKEWVFWKEASQKPIGKKGAYWEIGKLSQRVLGRKLDLYTFRHSIATILYNKEGLKDSNVATQMGHNKSMKGTYVHNDKKKLRENARKIYMSPEELPAEKKHELENRIDFLLKTIQTYGEALQMVSEKVKLSKKEKNEINILNKNVEEFEKLKT
jgi:integrase